MPGPMGIGPFERLNPDARRIASPVLRGWGGSATVSTATRLTKGIQLSRGS